MSDLAQLYQQVILDHSRQRTGEAALLAPPAGERPEGYGSSHQVNPTCGDEITVEVFAGSAAPVRWQGEGCSISMAAASVASEILAEDGPERFRAAEEAFRALMHSRGRGTADEELLGDAAAFHGVAKFPGRIKCALLAWAAIADALAQAESTSHAEYTEGGRP
ncbi:Fe-S cluster assembly sulfur transfer protein SufU [Brevibacterium album]|uniref:Fe-S cluster assembly sulfur transfer protein SufU n=1 Tax=Brevibacterium album TaxID=417948 RepID=UPI00040ECA0C|nr:SUF system NifU family Fe-S cluster assembly protein [Brevibacterium album]